MQRRTARGKHQGARGYGAEQRAQLAEKSLSLPIRQQPVRGGGANRNQRRGGGRDFAEHLEHAARLEAIEMTAHQRIQEQEIERRDAPRRERQSAISPSQAESEDPIEQEIQGHR